MFVAQALNRAHNRRKSEAWIRERLRDPGSRFLPMWKTRMLFTGGDAPQPVLLSRNEIEQYIADPEEYYFLGEEDGCGYFTAEIRGYVELPSDLAAFGVFRDLRPVAPLLSKNDGALLAYAKTLVYWHKRNRFCGSCGRPTRVGEGGQVRSCTGPDCGSVEFPRTDPAIIVLITSGKKCLLGRQAIWPERMYSVIAGFVAPGESAETAVVREAFEETGIHVRNIYYQSSQPWPFPCSLMLGFTAEAENEDIRLGDKELEDARWFDRGGIRSAVENGTLKLPSSISISFHLLEDWFDLESPVRLRDLALRDRVA